MVRIEKFGVVSETSWKSACGQESLSAQSFESFRRPLERSSRNRISDPICEPAIAFVSRKMHVVAEDRSRDAAEWRTPVDIDHAIFGSEPGELAGGLVVELLHHTLPVVIG